MASLSRSQLLVYGAVAGYIGSDTFTYLETDTNGITGTGTVTVTVTAAPAPTATDDTATLVEMSSAVIVVLANDIGSSLTLALGALPQFGTVAIANGKITYTPNAGYSGADTFSYGAISDSAGGVGKFDTITDFVSGTDKVDVASPTTPATPCLSFVIVLC